MWGHPGFCGVTNVLEGVQCLPTEVQGSWRLDVPHAGAARSMLGECIGKCLSCERCRFISLSRKDRDCSWYAGCDSLQKSVKHYNLAHRTYTVRHTNGSTAERAARFVAAGSGDFESEGIDVSSTSPHVVCFGERCAASLAAAHAESGASREGWVGALPPLSAVGGRSACGGRAGCWPHQCGTCADYSFGAGGVFNLSARVDAASSPRRRRRLLERAASASHVVEAPGGKRREIRRVGWVRTLTQSLYAKNAAGRWPGAPTVGPLPCSSARYEDGVVLRTFFSDVSGAPLRSGVFLEMGAYDGDHESTSWFFERCLGWRGVLVEAMPRNFAKLLRGGRPTLNVRAAACAEHGFVNFTDFEGASEPTYARAVEGRGTPGEALHRDTPSSLMTVQCGKIGDYLSLLGVHSIDFFSLDVEGSELTAVRGLGLGARLSIGVLLVEVRPDGQRASLVRTLLELGLSYVGQVHGRASPSNEIIDDVYVNATHLRSRFPTSAAALELASAAPSGDA